MSNLNLNPKQFEKYNHVEDVPSVKTRVYTQCMTCDHEGEFNAEYTPEANDMAYKCHKCGAEHNIQDWFENNGGELMHPDNKDEALTTENLHTALSKPNSKLPPSPDKWK
jgi:DNA-directed RNA polymerase subunit RPC12/RpoP